MTQSQVSIYIMNKESEINVWFDHLDETPEERVLWAEVDQPAAASITEDQEVALRQLSHARIPSFMDYRIRVRWK